MTRCNQRKSVSYQAMIGAGFFVFSIGQDAAIYNKNFMIKIHSNGKTEWLYPAEISSICQIDIKNFPFDTQQCKLKFGCWAYTGGEVSDILH
jgi:hypothetical protein